MSIRLKPVGEIKIRLGINPNGRVQRFFTNTCYKHMDKYVPKDNEILRTDVRQRDDSITYESPYAHAQYIGYTNGPVKKYTTPGTGPYWDKRMVSAEMSDVISEVQNYIYGGKK